ncbi:NAD(P)-dependent oxidoreductase [Microbacterium sp. 4R-513]|nr:NAD(P)-dependent oxidoreductase [Microbacterium sp. 4R-513]
MSEGIGMSGAQRVGFVGLGVMGQPMAMNLARAGVSLTVWNRTAVRAEPLRRAGAAVAGTVDEVFAGSDVVVVMLFDERATDEVLGRGTSRFADLVRGRLLVQMGTVSADYSISLERDVEAAGGRFVEAPVSGSRGPAEQGALVGMLAGQPADVALVAELIRPLCAEIVPCGLPPAALAMKFSVNVFLITMVTGLAESYNFAEQHGLDTAALARILDAGPMASFVSRGKLDKLQRDDLAPHAAISDVLKNCRLVTSAARSAGAAAPLMDASEELYREAVECGEGGDDMIGIVASLRRRSMSHPSGSSSR